MTHCRRCGVLGDVGEEVICEDCADKMVAPKSQIEYKTNKCEWCGKTTVYTKIKYREDPEQRFVFVYDKEHCICDDCYEGLR